MGRAAYNGPVTLTVSTTRLDSADGKRFLISTIPGEASEAPITVVANWQAELKK